MNSIFKEAKNSTTLNIYEIRGIFIYPIPKTKHDFIST